MKRTLFLLLMTLSFVFSSAKGTFPVYAWISMKNDEGKIREQLSFLKSHGVTGVCIHARRNPESMQKFASIAKEYSMEVHAWYSALQVMNPDSSWYTVNRLGQSSLEYPPYVSWYKTLDPHNPEVIKRVVERFSKVAEIPEIDYIHLDFIRYTDVILARGLWQKYHLIMTEEYPAADYCYCDECVADFKAQTGIDIKKVEDPSKCKQWEQFRLDNITSLVNKIAEVVHAKGKKLSAAVFPGPDSYAKWMVRQKWDQWNLDAVFPMNYNDFYLEGPEWVGKITREEVKSVKGKMKVYSGLFICHDWRNKQLIKDLEYSGLLPSELEEAIRGAKAAGADGICLFTDGRMSDEHWTVLDKVMLK